MMMMTKTKMMRRWVKLSPSPLGFRSLSSYDGVNLPHAYKDLINNPPFLANFGKGYFNMLTANFLCLPPHETSDYSYSFKHLYKPVSVQLPYNFVVSGPCHGLFCLYTVDGQIALWNPGTGDIMNLSSNKEQDEVIEVQNVGFGFDSNLNDYKIVRSITRRLVDSYYKSVDQMIHQVEIYTLKTKQWREIPVLGELRSHLPCILSPATFVDGACYWTSVSPWERENENDKETKRLISFDFVEEDFHLLSLPPDANGFNSFEIYNFNGCPAAFGCFTSQEKPILIHIWTWMPVNGVKTWVYQMEVPLFFHPRYSGRGDDPITPLCLWKNQGLIFLDMFNVLPYYYDFKTRKVSEIFVAPDVESSEPPVMHTIENPPLQVLNFPTSFVPNPW